MSCALDLAAGLVLAAQAAGQAAGEPPAPASRGPVAVTASASASVRVLRPARVDIARWREERPEDTARTMRARQGRVDAAGTIWIEFS